MKKKQEGFTLIELIIVIAILAIIAAIAVPNILGAVDNSRKSTDVANAKIILNAAAQVKAKDASLADAAGNYTINASGVNAVTGTNAGVAAFATALQKELNNAGITAKYKNAGAFTLAINGTDNTMTVSTSIGQVAPNPDSDYDQD